MPDNNTMDMTPTATLEAITWDYPERQLRVRCIELALEMLRGEQGQTAGQVREIASTFERFVRGSEGA